MKLRIILWAKLINRHREIDPVKMYTNEMEALADELHIDLADGSDAKRSSSAKKDENHEMKG